MWVFILYFTSGVQRWSCCVLFWFLGNFFEYLVVKELLVKFLCVLSIGSVCMGLELPSFFSNGMVLQRDSEAPIWGRCHPMEKVVVTFGDGFYTAFADEEGAWEISLNNLASSSVGKDLLITTDSSQITIKDVLVGEVWIASGQSNMEWPMRCSYSNQTVYNSPLIRQFSGSNASSAHPEYHFSGKWKKGVGNDISNFSAVAYHFAESIQAELQVPVGIIELAWGGRPIQSFIRREVITKLPEAKRYLINEEFAIEHYNNSTTVEGREKFRVLFHQYEGLLSEWEKGGSVGAPPKKPVFPENPIGDSRYPSAIYNGMIHPFIGYGLRGVIWYQGENNTHGPQATNYGELLEAMVNDWRSQWEMEFPFYWVQLASYMEQSNNPNQDSGWVHVQDEQRRALDTIPNSGMAVISDIGDAKDIHPANKKDVGKRLARWALAKSYHVTDIDYSGPLYSGTHFENEKAVISFHYADGLKSMDGKPLQHFALAGEDGKWVWANATINGDKVVVTSPHVSRACKVRYAWLENAMGANLTNRSGLPASCFASEVE